MFNAKRPSLEELPTSGQLIRSTILAAGAAAVILVTVVLPAEYGIDPTGVGSVLGLSAMGEIKQELAEEAERDRLIHGETDENSSLVDDVLGLFVSTANAQEVWRDEITFTLPPNAATEIKLMMTPGDEAEYAWTAQGGRINYDLHAHGNGRSVDYARGRGETSGEGRFEAPFAGEHGWFWRNRDSADVTVTLQLRGDYIEVVQSN